MKKNATFFPYSINLFSKGLAALSGIGILAITLIVTVDVGMRYLLNSPLLFAEEICEFVLALIAFTGFAYTFQKGGHIKIDLIIRRFSQKLQHRVYTVTLSLAIAYLTIFTWQILLFIKESYLFNRKSTVLLFPIWVPQLSMLIGSLAILLTLILEAMKRYRNYDPK
jgi:C4-dicarboxylate transporter DctQ subunit